MGLRAQATEQEDPSIAGDCKAMGAGKVRGGDEARSIREDRLNHSTSVSEIHQAEKGRAVTEQLEGIHGSEYRTDNKDSWAVGIGSNSKRLSSKLLSKHTRNVAQTEPEAPTTCNEEDKEISGVAPAKDFLLQIAALERGDQKLLR